MLTWWRRRFPRRPGFMEAYAQALADIERDYPIEQMRAEQRMAAVQRQIARELLRKHLDGGGEYERGEPGLQ